MLRETTLGHLRNFVRALQSATNKLLEGATDGESFNEISEFESTLQYGKKTLPQMNENLIELIRHQHLFATGLGRIMIMLNSPKSDWTKSAIIMD